MGMFFDPRRPSLWVYFQKPNTHFRAFHTEGAPPPPGGGGGGADHGQYPRACSWIKAKGGSLAKKRCNGKLCDVTSWLVQTSP